MSPSKSPKHKSVIDVSPVALANALEKLPDATEVNRLQENADEFLAQTQKTEFCQKADTGYYSKSPRTKDPRDPCSSPVPIRMSVDYPRTDGMFHNCVPLLKPEEPSESFESKPLAESASPRARTQSPFGESQSSVLAQQSEMFRTAKTDEPEQFVMPAIPKSDIQRVVYGLDRVFDQNIDNEEDLKTFTVGTTPQADSGHPLDMDVVQDSQNPPDHWPLQGIVHGTQKCDAWEFDEWFESFGLQEETWRLPPVYARRENIGTVPEPKTGQEEQDQDGDSEAADSKKKKKKSRDDLSPDFICIILADGRPLLPYTDESVQSLGNQPQNRFATIVKIDDRQFIHPELNIAVNVCYGNVNVQIAKISLAFQDLVMGPESRRMNEKEFKDRLGLTDDDHPGHGAFVMTVTTDNRNSTVEFHERAIRDLAALGMPRLPAFQQQIEDHFRQKRLQLNIMVTDLWEDFLKWMVKCGEVFAKAQEDPRAILKKTARGQPITIRNYTALPLDARKLPARMRFRDVDEAITVLGDGAAREHAYEKYATRELSNIQCQAVMMPIGSQKCKVTKKDGKVVDAPYLYSVSVVKTSDPEKFAQLAPALNVASTIQIQVDYRKMETPTTNMSEKEIVEIVARSMHNQLWNHRRSTKVDKAELNQAWTDDYADIIESYVRREKFEDNDKYVQGFAYLLSLKLQKVRADKDTATKAETPKEHHGRTREVVNQYRNHLKIPVDTAADVPQCTAVRMAHDAPLDRLSDFQFIAVRPKQPGWPRGEGIDPPPFLDMREPTLPRHGGLENLVSMLTSESKHLKNYLVPIKFVAVDDDVTAKSKVQGLLGMKEFQNTPLVNWFSTFEGNPITTDVTQIFSVLQMVVNKHYYDPALPFQDTPDIPLEPLHPQSQRDGDGKIIAATTREFQRREAIVARLIFNDMKTFSDDQLRAMEKLMRAPFAQVFIEGVPGSGKTWLTTRLLLATLYSSIDGTLVTQKQPVRMKLDLIDSEPEDSDDEEYDIKPEIVGVEAMPHEEEEVEKDTPQENLLPYYNIPRLACGPTPDQFHQILAHAREDSKTHDDYVTSLFKGIRKTYLRNFGQMTAEKVTVKDVARVRDSHWQAWVTSITTAINQEDELSFNPGKEDEPRSTEEILREMKAGKKEDTPPKVLECDAQAMIIANQNVNGDDLAQLMDKLLNEELQFDELIIRVTNLRFANRALRKGFRPQHEKEFSDAPSMADLIQIGIDKTKLDDFANREGQFNPQRHGGIWRLEDILRRRLEDGERPALFRQLLLLADPNHAFTKEELKTMNKNIDDFIRDVLADAKVIVCTFVVAQSLIHKELCTPAVVLIDEASRESELHIRWAQVAIPWQLLICTGDWRQDQPFVNGRYSSEKSLTNIHMDQLLTPLSRRLMESRPDCVVFLAENRRQHGGLQDIASDAFYGGEMRTVYNPDYPSQVEYAWHLFGQECIMELRARLRNNKDLNEGKVAEFLTGNRITVLCNSVMGKRGLSPVNSTQARLAVEYVAKIHQSQIPGIDGVNRPTICIITPYVAQVDTIKGLLRTLSNKEYCEELVEIRTQAAATGGEWDVVILCFVRDASMGFLAETNRVNVMLTRPRLFSVDILDEEFFKKPRGRQSHVIRHYAATQGLNGAYVTDIRNWGQVCLRCYLPHQHNCREDPKCFACNEGHHTRNCRKETVMTSLINPDEINLPSMEYFEVPAIEEESTEQQADEPVEQQADEDQDTYAWAAPMEPEDTDMPQTALPARSIDPEMRDILDELLGDQPDPLDMAPDPEMTAAAEQMFRESENEDEEEDLGEDSDDFKDFSTGKRTTASRKKTRRNRKVQKKKAVWTAVAQADNEPVWKPSQTDTPDAKTEEANAEITVAPDPEMEETAPANEPDCNGWDHLVSADNNTAGEKDRNEEGKEGDEPEWFQAGKSTEDWGGQAGGW